MCKQIYKYLDAKVKSLHAKMDLPSVIRAVRGLIVLAVPAYKSYCLIRLLCNEYQEDDEMPTDLAARIQDASAFWIAFALSMAAEYILDQFFLWVPYYELFKSLYFYWLGQHDFSCALLLYRVFICPPLQDSYTKIQKKITSPFEALEWVRTEVAKKVTKFTPSEAAT